MGSRSQMQGTPWHYEYLSDESGKKNSKNCAFNDEGRCSCKISINYNKECIGKRECEEFEYGSFRGRRKNTYISNSDGVTKTYKAEPDVHTRNYKYESIKEDKCVYILENICIMNDVHKTCIGYKKCEHFISLYERRKLSQKRKIEDEFEFKKIVGQKSNFSHKDPNKGRNISKKENNLLYNNGEYLNNYKNLIQYINYELSKSSCYYVYLNNRGDRTFTVMRNGKTKYRILGCNILDDIQKESSNRIKLINELYQCEDSEWIYVRNYYDSLKIPQ